MDDKWNNWNITDEQLIEILRSLGNTTRKMNRNYDRTIYDVAADRIERLLRSSQAIRDELKPRPDNVFHLSREGS